MTINYDKRKFDVDGAIAAAVDKKLLKLAKFFEDDAVADVKFTETRGRVVAEITIRNNRMYFRAEERAQDALTATDGAVDSIMRQIRKNKTRLARRLRQDAFVRSVQEETSFAPDAGEDDLTIAKIKSFYFKPMTREEAVMQMNLLGHNFFAFRDEDNGGSFAVVYRRNDGGYGIIDDVD